MMTNSTRCEWDVLIVDATGRSTGEATRLLDELARYGLLIRLDVISPPRVAVVSDFVVDHSKRSAYCVILRTTKDDRGQDRTEFIAVPAPHFADPNPVLATAEERVPQDSVEVGNLGDGGAGLADRIVRRLRS